jgi:hypothetical protein
LLSSRARLRSSRAGEILRVAVAIDLLNFEKVELDSLAHPRALNE